MFDGIYIYKKIKMPKEGQVRRKYCKIVYIIETKNI